VEDLVKAYRKRPVGAHYGLGDWLLQRLTALVMAVYTVAIVACLLMHAPQGHAEWKAIFGGGLMRVATMLFFAALAYHAWIGMRDILMDYLRATSLRLTAEAAVGIVLLAYVVWAAAILWGR
jgi:succinate dehydrogenase / fumarate reductase membrane anchor subunit